ncbi:MAG: hypothetical protein JO210_12790 [Acidobacteriaceae bacterium]|nr:hypothetical protein [Acidobacteriaceae bacterium]
MNRDLALWIGVLGGPLIWLCSFEARFALAPWACTFQSKAALFAVALAALALCAASTWLALKQWKSLGKQGPTSEEGALPRSAFMAIGGIVLSTGCFLIVLAQAIPEMILGVCE